MVTKMHFKLWHIFAISNIILWICFVMNSFQQINNKNSSCYRKSVYNIYTVQYYLLRDQDTSCIRRVTQVLHKKILIKKQLIPQRKNVLLLIRYRCSASECVILRRCLF